MKIQAKVTVTSTVEEVKEATGADRVLNWGNGWADVLPTPEPPKRKRSKKVEGPADE